MVELIISMGKDRPKFEGQRIFKGKTRDLNITLERLEKKDQKDRPEFEGYQLG